jgi:hypothetical protein
MRNDIGQWCGVADCGVVVVDGGVGSVLFLFVVGI